MNKRYLLLLAASFFMGSSHAQDVQPCGTDQIHRQLVAEHPEILQVEAEFERQVKEGMSKIDLKTAKKTTGVDQSGNENFWYDIPVVVHIVHDYNAYNTSSHSGDYVPDDFIFNAVKEWNVVFAKQNSDTASVIPPFKKWIGNPHIRLHLATIDPNGNRTKGITRRRSYRTYNGGQDAKFDDWSPTSYINIWFINKMSAANGNAAAYAHFPADVTYIPFYDGVISLAEYMNNGSKTINHELGHSLNLSHVWGNTNNAGVACGDDGVEDTPPTAGHNITGCTLAALYDTNCSINYLAVHTDAITGAAYVIDYPDTNNSQNIMDYTYCDRMFTKGQATRMHLTLNNSIAGRNNLWDSLNLIATGALAPIPDLKPIPDFSVSPAIITSGSYLNKNGNFAFPGVDVKFTNQTMNDTVTALTWTFSNGASVPTSTSLSNFNNKFSEPGWVNIKMTATGNHSGDTTVEWNKSVFVADNTGTSASGYLMEFNPGAETDKWPMFNYYNNEFKWQTASVGVYDNTSIMYKGFDDRVTATSFPTTGSPKGDFDDMFSVPVDLSAVGSPCNLNFYYSGASRSSNTSNINDSLYIDYSIGKSTAWVSLAKLGKGQIFNKGSLTTPYVPLSITDWATKSIPIPAAAITNYTVFRFRYMPGTTTNAITSSGNNFYIDRVNFNPWPAEVIDVAAGKTTVSVVPNPTQGDAYVIVKDADHSLAQITVTDITGKAVYTATAQVKGSYARIQIPASAISVPGMYLVQTLTGNQVNTQKLVVY